MDGLVSVPADTAIDIGIAGVDSAHITFWVNIGALPASDTAVVYKLDVGSGWMIELTTDGKLRWSITSDGATFDTVTSTALTVSTWYWIEFGKNNVLLSSKVNTVQGAITPLANATTSIAGANLIFASDSFNFVNIAFDDFRIYKATISASDVVTIYNSGAGVKYAAGQCSIEPSFVMEFDADFVSDEIFSTVPDSPALVGTRTGGAMIEAGGVPFFSFAGSGVYEFFDEAWSW